MASPLSKFSAQEWDCFLTIKADCFAVEECCPKCIYQRQCCKLMASLPLSCLVCDCFLDGYEQDCDKCMPEEAAKSGTGTGIYCINFDQRERCDLLIERLYKEGIFTD